MTVGERGKKHPPPTPTPIFSLPVFSFFPASSTNVEIIPQTLSHFLFESFFHTGVKFPAIPSVSLREPRPTLKKEFSWSNPYKCEVRITFLIKILELLNLDQMNTSMI